MITKEEYLKRRAKLDKQDKILTEKYKQLRAELDEHIPFPKGTFIEMKMISHDTGSEYTLNGYVQSWHTDYETAEFRPELRKLRRDGIVGDNHICYPWKDKIVSMEEWKPKKVKTCENCLWLGIFKNSKNMFCHVYITGYSYDENGKIRGSKMLAVESKEQLACMSYKATTWPKITGETNWDRLVREANESKGNEDTL